MSGIAKFRKIAAGRSAFGAGPAAAAAGSAAPSPLADAPWGSSDEIPCETRGEHRFVPIRTATVLTTACGKQVPARIINVSRTGVALEADLSAVAPRQVVKAGTRPVTPGRAIARGAVFLFVRPLDKRLCNQSLVL